MAGKPVQPRQASANSSMRGPAEADIALSVLRAAAWRAVYHIEDHLGVEWVPALEFANILDLALRARLSPPLIPNKTKP
jgi:hypothetical protein